jgi:SOS-response transcriptional repressor LexA
LLAVALADGALTEAGVLLEDPATDRLWIRLRRDWDHIAGEEAEVLSELEADLETKAAEFGAARLLATFEQTLSNLLRITDRQETLVGDFERALERLYRSHVRATVQPFVTHLPRYSLAVAAGPFLENSAVAEESWEEVFGNTRLTSEMFIARIAGHSMQPHIPDGSLCVFRRGVVGSRQGKLVLVEDTGAGPNDRYTVKRYRSEKRQNPNGTWAHDHITLEPLNPEYQAFDLDPEEDRFRILAEFVSVL